MGRSHSTVLRLAVAVLSLWSIGGCGKGTKAGPPLFPGQITLTPSSNLSVELGSTFTFTATARTSGGVNLNTPITFTSTDTSIVNVAPGGVACAGTWNVSFTTCTPAGTGVVTVTASALGQSSVPTYVFVHPHVDNVTIAGIFLNGIPVQEPCLSQGQSMTLEAHAFSQGSDVTSAVGPFTFTAQNAPVVNMVGVLNTAYNFPTNQVTATASVPGMTRIYASASGVTSSAFVQPQFSNAVGQSPVLDFFETCPIQTINLEIGAAGNQQTSQTTFLTSSSSTATQTATAIVTDVMGISSLPNTSNGLILTKVPLTWSASQPAVVHPASGCLQSCGLSTPLAGSGSVTASCSPPTCNIGYPQIPASLSTPAAIQSCSQFFASQPGIPSNFSCQQLIPVPVYASPLQPGPPVLGNGSVSGLVTGNPTPPNLLATSTGCAHLPPTTCTTNMYSFVSGKGSPGSATPMPTSPNSILFDVAGDKAFVGSDYGALVVNPANFGTSTSPFTGLGTVTGTVLAVSNNGNTAIFSDTLHTPNQVYVVNTGNASSLSASALNISQAVTAAFAPDNLKTFIAGNGGTSLYIYSPLQALQGPGLQGPGSNLQLSLSGPAKAIAFSPSGAVAFVAEAAGGGNPANLTAFDNCNNQIAAPPVTLPHDPLFMKVLPGLHLEGRDSYGNTVPDGTHVLVLDATGFDIITTDILPPASGTTCPQTLTFTSNPNPPNAPVAQRVELGHGIIQPINFFVSSDGTQLYIPVIGSASILIYDFSAGTVTSGIQLVGNATPIGADISADTYTIVVAGSDGLLHEVSTGLSGSDQQQVTFPNLPDYLNGFCAITTPQNPCSLNLIAARP
ncbi:MAG TPA: hypothetical protein VFL34_17480 [Candidatus Sulfotelmatobacter sp.]|nr:hypothetical protein [Candidatus Sulfotelmatobacter sp.]